MLCDVIMISNVGIPLEQPKTIGLPDGVGSLGSSPRSRQDNQNVHLRLSAEKTVINFTHTTRKQPFNTK